MKTFFAYTFLFGVLCLPAWSAEEKPVELVAQKTCPVMGGDVNKSLFVDFEGKRIYVCCGGCINEVKKDPAKYIEKLAKAGEKVDRTPDHVTDGVSFIGIDTLKKLQADKNPPVVIDVLPKEYYDKAHIDGAINIPLNELEAKAAELDKNKKIVVYCASYTCHASTAAAKILTKLGFKDVHDYKGGIKEWLEESKGEKVAACLKCGLAVDDKNCCKNAKTEACAKCGENKDSANCCKPKAGCGTGGCGL
jgi:rhodanese-related sulfurtransferase